MARSAGSGPWTWLAAMLCIAAIAGCGGSHSSRSPGTAATATTARIQTRRTAVQHPKPPGGPTHPVLVGQIPDRLHTMRHVVALTFDAGADDAGAPKIFAALSRAGVTATFFMTGRWADLYPQWARRIAARYAIANHTFDHTDLLSLTLPAVRDEVVRASAAIQHATGHPPVRMFRFPYGSSSPGTLALVNRLGYTAIGWTVDTLGWEGTSMGQSVSSVASRALGHLEPGEIVLMHVGANPQDHSTLDADALPGIITAIRARGYEFVNLSEYP